MGGSDSKGGSQSKRRAHTAKLVAGVAALFVLGVLASGAVADPGLDKRARAVISNDG